MHDTRYFSFGQEKDSIAHKDEYKKYNTLQSLLFCQQLCKLLSQNVFVSTLLVALPTKGRYLASGDMGGCGVNNDCGLGNAHLLILHYRDIWRTSPKARSSAMVNSAHAPTSHDTAQIVCHSQDTL
jgi:hypothetical protein